MPCLRGLLLLALASAAACGEDERLFVAPDPPDLGRRDVLDEGLPRLDGGPLLRADRELVDFGPVVVATSSIAVAWVQNLTNQALTLRSSVAQCPTFGDLVCFENASPLEVAAEGRLPIRLRFAPTGPGERLDQLWELSVCPDAECKLELRLSGFGVGSGFSCEPSRLDFGSVPLGAAQVATVTCTNGANTQVESARAMIIPAETFVATSSLPESLGPSQQLFLQVRFRPSREGLALGTLRLLGYEGGRSLQRPPRIALRGEGTAP